MHRRRLEVVRALRRDRGYRLKELTDALHGATSLFAPMAARFVLAVNGTAAGAGFRLSLIGDYVLAAKSARFTVAYTAAGLTSDGSATCYLPQLVGVRRAQEPFSSSRMRSAKEAADEGIVTRVVENLNLPHKVIAVCGKLAVAPGRAHGNLKELLSSSFANGLEEQVEIEGREIARSALPADGREGVGGFVEWWARHFLKAGAACAKRVGRAIGDQPSF